MPWSDSPDYEQPVRGRDLMVVLVGAIVVAIILVVGGHWLGPMLHHLQTLGRGR